MIRDPMQALERDLQAERASALARIADLFEKALEAWEALEAGEVPPLASAEAELARRTEVRELTAERLWMLLVQRETVGLRDHRGILQGVPKEIRRRIGPRRRVSPRAVTRALSGWSSGLPTSEARSSGMRR